MKKLKIEDSSYNVPTLGDTLYLFTKKGLSVYDTIKVYGLADITTQKFEKTNVNLDIPDGGEINDIIPVSIVQKKMIDYNLSEITVTIDTILHSNISDLVILLSHAGITDTLFNQAGAGENMIGCRLSDFYNESLTNSSAPFTGKFNPFKPLLPYYNTDLNGEWMLTLKDVVLGNTGTLRSWGINFNFINLTDANDISITKPENYELYQNYPNPFNPSTKIIYQIPQNSMVSLKIYDRKKQNANKNCNR